MELETLETLETPQLHVAHAACRERALCVGPDSLQSAIYRMD
jgi:hypothetical protein